MENCEHCGQPFKTAQGLSGHYRMKHNTSTDQYRAEYRPTNERELLQNVQEQLGRLEELEQASALIDKLKAAAIEEVHKHGMSDPECPGCIEVVRQTLNTVEQKARDEIAAFYEEIPGVTQLRETWERLKAEGKDTEQELITITGLRDRETAEDAIRAAIRKASEEDDLITIIG